MNSENNKHIVIGITAHVDSGKTTLSEAMLYECGKISKIGRVDHGDAYLDTDEIEKERGITIFSKQAEMCIKDCEITLLDTPGHIDFTAEAERVMNVLDYAILVISGSEGIQSHTVTLWKMLEHYNIPTFIFVNKMDLPGADKNKIMEELNKKLSMGCLDFNITGNSFFENAATVCEELLEEFIQEDKISINSLKNAVLTRKIFPCYFGSALKNEGVKEFLNGLYEFYKKKKYPERFGARVYKISEDNKGIRLAHMKITGGELQVKDIIKGNGWDKKVNEIRIYSGAKYETAQRVKAGSICAVSGLSQAVVGDGFGYENSSEELITEPLFSYSVRLSEGEDIHKALEVFRKLESEQTGLHIIWDEYLQKINIRVMGEIQLEVLKRILKERYELAVEFEHGSIIYKETVKNTVEGVGHYEPLRHYAEVHLLIEPAKRGEGIILAADCSFEKLDRNYQALVMTHLAEKEHKGVLTGSLLTDVKITLVNGKAHLKHTEGGDFRQATYRAVRQGLMLAESVLLEPYYNFSIELPHEYVGRAMTDLQQIGAEFSTDVSDEEITMLKGKAPVGKLMGYGAQILAYTKGTGRFSCSFSGYEECKNAEEVIQNIGYNAEADTDNTADSIFCSHGSGFLVKWDKVYEYMHLEKYLKETELKISNTSSGERKNIVAGEEELLRIFERTYGKIKRRSDDSVIRTQREKAPYKPAKPVKKVPQYLLIDGYNIIFADEELTKAARESLDDARLILTKRVCNLRAIRDINVILVFDAYKVKGNVREYETVNKVNIVYTKEAETADTYIENTSQQLVKNYRVRVATSDSIEQMIIFGNGAERIPAREFLNELDVAEQEMRDFIKEYNNQTDEI